MHEGRHGTRADQQIHESKYEQKHDVLYFFVGGRRRLGLPIGKRTPSHGRYRPNKSSTTAVHQFEAASLRVNFEDRQFEDLKTHSVASRLRQTDLCDSSFHQLSHERDRQRFRRGEADRPLAGVVVRKLLLVSGHRGATHEIKGAVLRRRPHAHQILPVEPERRHSIVDALLRLRRGRSNGLTKFLQRSSLLIAQGGEVLVDGLRFCGHELCPIERSITRIRIMPHEPELLQSISREGAKTRRKANCSRSSSRLCAFA